jgi:hypothetical protein
MRALDLHGDDLVSRELSAARERVLRAALLSLAHEPSPVAELVRQVSRTYRVTGLCRRAFFSRRSRPGGGLG